MNLTAFRVTVFSVTAFSAACYVRLYPYPALRRFEMPRPLLFPVTYLFGDINIRQDHNGYKRVEDMIRIVDLIFQ